MRGLSFFFKILLISNKRLVNNLFTSKKRITLKLIKIQVDTFNLEFDWRHFFNHFEQTKKRIQGFYLTKKVSS